MNKRIQELYGNALDQAVPYTWHRLDHVEVEKIMKEYAHLLLKQALAQIDQVRDDMDRDGKSEQALGATWAAYAVAKHFGVKE